LDLLNTVKVHTIIGPDTFIGSELLGSISDKAKVPIFSFADSGIGVEDVIWSGGSTTNPKGWILPTSNGKKLRIGVRTGLRFKFFVNAVYDNQTNVTTATGFAVDVFKTCIQALPYEVPYEFIPFANGSYDKLIEKVYNKEIDGVLGDATILAN
ncbi:hypothetical protein Tco_1323476, partial [Tanacetum coccineum]